MDSVRNLIKNNNDVKKKIDSVRSLILITLFFKKEADLLRQPLLKTYKGYNLFYKHHLFYIRIITGCNFIKINSGRKA